MGKRLYVGNLSFNTTEDLLRAAFEEGGRQIAGVSIIMDRETGRSRGFGFVEMANDAEAEAAITALNGAELGGRTLVVNKARPKN